MGGCRAGNAVFLLPAYSLPSSLIAKVFAITGLSRMRSGTSCHHRIDTPIYILPSISAFYSPFTRTRNESRLILRTLAPDRGDLHEKVPANCLCSRGSRVLCPHRTGFFSLQPVAGSGSEFGHQSRFRSHQPLASAGSTIAKLINCCASLCSWPIETERIEVERWDEPIGA